MAWVKLDDQFFRHPKVVNAGRDARDLYLAGLCYCGSGLTDGLIPAAAVRILAADADIDNPISAADRLVSVGLWERCPEGFKVHDYLEFNPTKEQVLATREARAEAGRRGGIAKAEQISSKLPSKTPSKTEANAKQNSSKSLPRTPTRLDTRIDPVKDPNGLVVGEESEEGKRDPRGSPKSKQTMPLPDDFTVTDEMTNWALSKGFDFSFIEEETERFKNHAVATARTQVDWSRSWMNWLTSPYAKSRASPNGTAKPRNKAQDQVDMLLRIAKEGYR